ncbi:OLC1v1001603C1 [Oldenlandia corymbosa var. corymbosa]|uniref:OLC1v1001603C1 n=1 Tax=Oldenlandia corymbosa var. corymbosa TaxID=529605 RepID=A0AAV1D8J2_OLDCO|nr:OLC1v1001603C1 [Oldenlandia corymbosa var. corymbosa]
MLLLPDELVVEILAWLPGKQLGRCKCVCKLWRSIIGSPLFRAVYRSRQMTLNFFWPEKNMANDTSSTTSVRLRYYDSNLRQLNKEQKFSRHVEGVSWRCAITIPDGLTQSVNGLVCHYDDASELSIYNICTGQRMTLPHDHPTPGSCFHLGYDPMSKMYKLLRLNYHLLLRNAKRSNPVGADIMTLRPSNYNSTSSWRKLDLIECGLGGILGAVKDPPPFDGSAILGNDGFLWWLSTYLKLQLFTFDLDNEIFQMIEFQEGIRGDEWRLRQSPVFTLSMGRPAIWSVGQDDPFRCFTLFVFEENKQWKKHCVQLPEQLGEVAYFVINIGNLPTGEILFTNVCLRNQDHCWPVCSYNHHTNKFECFVIENLPIPYKIPHDLVRAYNQSLICCEKFFVHTSFLQDSSSVYLTLDDVLSGGGALS